MLKSSKVGRKGAVTGDQSYFSRYRLSREESGLSDTPLVSAILRVKTLNESLRSCKTHSNLRVSRSSRSARTITTQSEKPKLDRAHSEQTVSTATSSTCNNTVTFAEVHTRLYHIECDDNPAISGRGPAIRLSWRYVTVESVPLDEYELSRPIDLPEMQDLKMGMAERERLLMESGASRKEMQEFARRVKKAKAKRLETVEHLKVYGKANMDKAERRAEKRETMSRDLLRLLHFRRTETEEQAALWRNARKLSNKVAATSS